MSFANKNIFPWKVWKINPSPNSSETQVFCSPIFKQSSPFNADHFLYACLRRLRQLWNTQKFSNLSKPTPLGKFSLQFFLSVNCDNAKKLSTSTLKHTNCKNKKGGGGGIKHFCPPKYCLRQLWNTQIFSNLSNRWEIFPPILSVKCDSGFKIVYVNFEASTPIAKVRKGGVGVE